MRETRDKIRKIDIKKEDMKRVEIDRNLSLIKAFLESHLEEN